MSMIKKDFFKLCKKIENIDISIYLMQQKKLKKYIYTISNIIKKIYINLKKNHIYKKRSYNKLNIINYINI